MWFGNMSTPTRECNYFVVIVCYHLTIKFIHESLFSFTVLNVGIKCQFFMAIDHLIINKYFPFFRL
jgi:hypothetical protein